MGYSNGYITGLPDVSNNVVDFVAGAGDIMSWGIGKWLRESNNLGSVNICSANYKYGTWAGAASTGISGIGRSGMRSIGRFFYDPRNFAKKSREYWKARGGANGMSLDHLFISQASVRSGKMPLGFGSAGFNLLVMPMRLNRWLGFAPRWGGSQAMLANATRYGINGSLVGISAGSAYAGFKIGNSISNPGKCGCQ